MILTKEHLLQDLYCAFYDARKRKAKRSYVLAWERNLKDNMEQLCDELWARTYKPLPSKCFIVEYPKKREIFAAVFRDRIVHHLYYYYTSKMFERTFIADSYSCIKGRGTLYGINRITDFLRKESLNWQEKCYALHLDIRGYFMHIDRQKLLRITLDTIARMQTHYVSKQKGVRWCDTMSIDFVKWLTEVIVMLDPKVDCIVVGDIRNWDGLEASKSLLKTKDGLGLPIGNLTSQLFSNVYLNVLDQYIKREIGCKYYGRYVDDALLISADKDWLLAQIPKIRTFLKSELGLQLHEGKLNVSEVHKGVDLLGVYIKPYRTYISHATLGRMEQKIKELDSKGKARIVRSLNSYLGLFAQSRSYKLRKKQFFQSRYLIRGTFNKEMTKIVA